MENTIEFTEHQKNVIARFNNAYNKCRDYKLKYELKVRVLNMVMWHSGDGMTYDEFKNELHENLNLLVFLGEIDVNQIVEKTDYLIYCRSYISKYRKDFFETLEKIEKMNSKKTIL